MGKTYVVQLGTLRNTDKVNKTVGKLRGAGYRVYILLSAPVQGKTTHTLVRPDASKDRLKGSLGELKQFSGLSGVIMGYTSNQYGLTRCGADTPYQACTGVEQQAG